MSARRIAPESILHLLAFSIAITIRFLDLGNQPLSDYEAKWALQALGVAQGTRPLLDPNPAYILLTAIQFFIFDATNFLARFWPAVAGSLLAVSPLFLRKRLGHIAALILSFGLAIDPGLVALSRLAGGPMMAITFAVYTWIAWEHDRPRLSGVMAAFALLSGPSLWPGLISAGIALGISRLLEKVYAARAQLPDMQTESESKRPAGERLKAALGWGAGTIILGGSLFLLSPNGWSALSASLPDYITGWWTSIRVPTRNMLIAIPAYAPFALAFGLTGLIRGWWKGDRTAIFLGFWSVAAFVLALAYPAREVGDLAWMSLSLWALAAMEISRHLDVQGLSIWELVGVNVLVVVILAFAWIDLAGLPGYMSNTSFAQTRIFLFLGAILLIALSLLLVGLGWSEKLAVIGATWGVGSVLFLYTLSAGVGAAGLRPEGSQELWSPGMPIGQADLLLQSVKDISEWQMDSDKLLSISIQGVDSPALNWLLRDWETNEQSGLDVSASPDLIITPQGIDIQQGIPYRGQDFTWRQMPTWQTNAPDDWLRWIVLRQMPMQSESIILWARNDLFLDDGITPELP